MQNHTGKEHTGWEWDNEKYMAENFPKKRRNMDPQIEEAVYTKQTKKVNITFYNVVRLKISEDTILLKGAIEETQIMHNKEQLLG